MSAALKPIHIDEFKIVIKSITDAEIALLGKQIHNSIDRLERSNFIMQALLQKAKGQEVKEAFDEEEFDTGEQDEEDLKVYSDSIRENEIVLDNLHKRVEALDDESLNRDITPPTKPPNVKPALKKVEVDADNDIIDSNAPNSVFL
ncbi:unnamed protein product [Kuraishia capsulata CBS 1993]|uniref:Uncharacterized protein n=1 Tax=Kuraishia capsulata CBS 1993 TaxID=1382522 RepID=W6MJB8_9ASCO|nr:uncharacterized protein KUCA_T00002024001 [Kuraishia capsulata CBS 1993]CDK26053.1 unnamed protein product [Kuraishia capsulata CBS 1993]